MGNDDEDFREPEDEEPYELELPEQLPVPHSALMELFIFMSQAREEEDKTMGMVRHYMNELYDEYTVEFPDRDSEVLASEIISYLCRRHKWNVELLWDKKDSEDMLFRRYNTYDPNIWAKVMETDALKDMHRAVYKLTQKYLAAALEEVIQPERTKKRRRRINRRER